ncbi:MAG: carbohydrate kinase family protein [Patescibacteria group bacterium]|jgi:ribokinase
MKYDVVTIGDASEDVFVRPVDMKITDSRSFTSGKVMSFELGEKIPIEDVVYDVGGTAANVAVGLSRCGMKTAIITAIGQDSPAERILACLDKEGVDSGCINIRQKNKTNFAVIINTPNGERTILVYHGIDYSNLNLKRSLNTSWIYLGPVGENCGEVIDQILTQVGERNARFAWNPGSYQVKAGASKFHRLLRNASVLFLNREEAIKFLDYPVHPKMEEVMKKLFQLGARIVVVTDGKEGVRAYDGEVFYQVDIIRNVTRVDATGAGDSFASGFMARFIDGQAKGELDRDVICDALKYGIVNSTSVVAQIGAQKGLLSVSAIEKGIAEHPRLRVDIYN